MSVPVCMVGTDNIPSRTWMPGTVTTNSFRWFFLSLGLFPQRHVLINSLLNAWEKRSRVLSSVSVQLSLLWYPECSSHFGLPGLSVLSPQLTESAKFRLGIVFCAIAWKPSQGSKLGASVGSLYLFLCSQELLCLLHDIQWVENSYFVYLIQFIAVVSGRRINPVSITPSCLGVKISIFFKMENTLQIIKLFHTRKKQIKREQKCKEEN